MNRRYVRILTVVTLSLLLLAFPRGTTAQLDMPPRVAEREAPERGIVVQPAAEQALSAQLRLAPVADTYIASERPTQNFGSSGLFLGYNLVGDNFGAQRIFLRFDVESSIPDGVTINQASLRLYLSFSSPSDDEPMGTRLWRVDSPWEEDMLTWNRWIAEGIRGDGEGYDVQFIGATEGWYEWEITDLVQQWYDGTHVNYGMLIIGEEEIQQRERAFFSRETPSAFYPQLVIDYATLIDDEPPVVTVDPLPEFVDRDFTVSWEGTDPGPAEIAYYDVQVRVDGGDWMDFNTGVTATEAEFVGQHGRLYEFRARGVDTAGNEEPFGEEAEASTTVDTMPPVTSVNPLPRIIGTQAFPVSWSGDDDGSGIASYNVIYRVNRGDWTIWLLATTETSAIFDVTTDDFPPTDGFYEFEVRAVDNVGNQEGFDFEPEASAIVDAAAPFIAPRLWLPIIAHQ